MTRQEAVAWQSRLFPCNQMLPEICLNLRMAMNGSADPWEEKTVAEVVAMLRARLETWEPGYKLSLAVDDAVKNLVQATLLEQER